MGSLCKDSASRQITQAELDAVVPALAALHVVELDGCGADKSEVTLTVRTASKTIEYRDAFYACRMDSRAMVESDTLDLARAALDVLAFGPRPTI